MHSNRKIPVTVSPAKRPMYNRCFCLLLATGSMLCIPAQAQTVVEAVNFLGEFVKCSPPLDVWDKKPPNEQLSGFTEKKNSFLGTSEKWIVVEDVTNLFRNVFNNARFNTGYVFKSEALFKNLNPDVRVTESEIRIQCRASSCFRIKKTFKDRELASIDKNETTSYQNYKFCNGDTARRIGNAISFLIKQNGGKASPF